MVILRRSSIGQLTGRRILQFLLIVHPVLLLTWYKGHFIIVAAGVLLVVVIDIFQTRGRIWFSTLPMPLYIFLILPITSTLWALYPADTLYSSLIVLFNVALFYLAFRSSSEDGYALITSLSVLVPVAFMLLYIFIYYQYGSIRAESREMHDNVKSKYKI